MAVNLLKKVQNAVTNHFLKFAKQTVLHGPKYFANHGTIQRKTDHKTDKVNLIKISRFDR